MNKQQPHIAVCVCTYRRPELLKRSLGAICAQDTSGLFTYSVVVVDNDDLRSAELTVVEFARKSPIQITYHVEPEQGIARARNKAVAQAKGDFLAFIDDDELSVRNWLSTLWKTCIECDADGVLGPVLRHFDASPPKWIEKSQLFVRPINSTGDSVRWQDSRTGNVLLKRTVVAEGEEPFRPEFRSGEDKDFFRRKIQEGYRFIWSSDARVYEVVPPARWKRAYMLRRALLRGANARLQADCGVWSIAKSFLAIPAYAAALPIAAVLGQQWFMTLLIKICDHAGKLLALAGVSPIKDRYVTE